MFKKITYFLGASMMLLALSLPLNVSNDSSIRVNAEEHLISSSSELQTYINNLPSGAKETIKLTAQFNIDNEIVISKPCSLTFEYITTFHLASKQRGFYIESNNVKLSFANASTIIANGEAELLDGRAIYIEGDNCLIENLSFEKCNSNRIGANNHTYAGAGIYIEGDKCEVKKCLFEKCEVSKLGGAVYIDGDKNLVSDCRFINCICGSDGGGIGIDMYSEENIITNCEFTSCEANKYDDADGGAIALWGPNNSISNCNFDYCKAKVCGGAIYVEYDDSKIINCNFKNCTALSDDGGAIYLGVDVDDITIQDCTFENCKAGDCGGAFYSNTFSYRTTFNNCTFTNCEAVDDDGGAIHVGFDCDDVVVYKCKFSGCKAGEDGGAIFISFMADDCVIRQCTFENCSAEDDGQYVLGDNDTLIYDCTPNTTNSDLFDDCEFKTSSNKMAGSTLSDGNFWIVIAIILVGGGAIVALILTRKRDLPVSNSNTKDTNKSE